MGITIELREKQPESPKIVKGRDKTNSIFPKRENAKKSTA
jgi:hypothetical protein